MDNSLYAAVDLGSNSFHMVIAHLSEGRFRIVDRIKERVRLAEGMDEQKRMSPEAMETRPRLPVAVCRAPHQYQAGSDPHRRYLYPAPRQQRPRICE